MLLRETQFSNSRQFFVLTAASSDARQLKFNVSIRWHILFLHSEHLTSNVHMN